MFHSDLDAYLVTRHETVRAVAADPVRFPLSQVDTRPPEVAEVLAEAGDVPAGTGVAPASTRELWHRVLHGTRVNRVRLRIAELAVRLAAGIERRGRADLVADFAHPLVRSVAGELLGIPPDEQDIVYGCAVDGLRWADPLAPMADRVAAARRYVAAQDYFRELRARRVAEPKDDIVSMLAGVADLPGTPLSHAEFTSVLLWFHGAGIDKTRDAIAATVHSMVVEGLWAKAVADRSLIPDAVEEALRRHAPYRGLPRTVTEDVVLDGVAIPAGARLLLLFDSANRDERRFADPDSFDVDREDVREHVAFGHGPHACAGAHLARTEARLAVEVLTRRLPDLALADGFEPRHTGGFFFLGPASLDVTWPVAS